MKILSIDVGIKNLAYCLFETNNNNYKIIKWDVINLLDTKICCNCNCPAKFTKDNIFYCRKHGKDSKFLIPLQCNNINQLKRLNIDELREYTIKNNINIDNIDNRDNIDNPDNINNIDNPDNINNTSNKNDKKVKEIKKPKKCLNKNEILKLIQQYNNKIYLDPVIEDNASITSLIDIGINLTNKLNIILDELNNLHKLDNLDELNNLHELDKLNNNKFIIDKILIENQLSNLAIRMKTLQGMITQYFIMKGFNNIEFISSCNKSKMFIENKNIEISKKLTYNERKKLSILSCENILNTLGLNKDIDFFIKHKKQDDLADCFLQGLYWNKFCNKFNN